MITDNETNFLYLADSLKKRKYSDFLLRFEQLLAINKIKYDFLLGTKDIWAVDYMPVQLDENKYIQFNYSPDYLQSKAGINTKTDVIQICKRLEIKPEKSALIVDGGNIVRWKNKVIMCDKVFKENPHLSEKQLMQQLIESMEIDSICFVPWDKKDIIGHADGMVRFIDGNTVLINNYNHPSEDSAYCRSFRLALRNAGYDLVELPYNPYSNATNLSAEGIYINYLQMKNVIIVPTYNKPEDESAIKLLEDVFRGNKIIALESSVIAKEGGVLNCISWNIMRKIV